MAMKKTVSSILYDFHGKEIMKHRAKRYIIKSCKVIFCLFAVFKKYIFECIFLYRKITTTYCHKIFKKYF